MTLLLSEADVENLLDLNDSIEAVESGFLHHGLGRAQSKPRREVRIRGKELPHADPRMVRIAQGLAFSDQLGVGILHHILSFPDGNPPSFRVINYLISGQNGDTLAIVNSRKLLGMRTGAAGAVSAKYLSRRTSKVAGVIGTGQQGRMQLRFLLKVRPIERAYIYDKIKIYKEKYAEEMSKELGIDVISQENVEQVVDKSDILVTATPSMDPYVKADWIHQGILINIIGADDPPKIELEGSALKKADKLIIMSEECFDAGQLRIPMEQGVLKKDDVYGTLGEIIAGLKPARERDDEIIIYHNPGMTLQDLVIVHRAYQKAMKLGIGKEVNDPFRQ